MTTSIISKAQIYEQQSCINGFNVVLKLWVLVKFTSHVPSLPEIIIMFIIKQNRLKGITSNGLKIVIGL